MMKKMVYICLMTVLISTKIHSQENELLSFMVYGNNFIASIALPNSWNVDMDYSKQIGVNGFFYPKKYNSNDSPVVIILDLVYKPKEETQLEELVNYNVEWFKNNNIGSICEELKMGNNKQK